MTTTASTAGAQMLLAFRQAAALDVVPRVAFHSRSYVTCPLGGNLRPHLSDFLGNRCRSVPFERRRASCAFHEHVVRQLHRPNIGLFATTDSCLLIHIN